MKLEPKTIKIGRFELKITKVDLIVLPIFIILIILFFMSPNLYMVTTARYGKGSETDNQNVKIALGEQNTEERFQLYFQWYNVIHELGHGILRYNSNIKLSSAEEEQLVNDFAVAYWLYYGEEDKINELSNIVEYAVNHIDSDVSDDITYMEFAEKNWNKPRFFTFNNYGWFQFSSVKESLNKRKSFSEVLKEMGIENIQLAEQKILQYPTVNEEVSTKIINDAIENFHEWGLKFPEVAHFFSNDPNANHSKPFRNFLGIFNLINN